MKTNSYTPKEHNVSGQNARVIVDLLSEYSLKLNDMVKEWDTHKRRGVSLMYTWFSIVGLVSIGYYSIDQGIKWSNAMLFSIALIIISSLIFVQSISIEIKQTKRIRESMRILVVKLERLVSRASQIEEHVEEDEEILLKLDLRLAEAENTLRLISEIL